MPKAKKLNSNPRYLSSIYKKTWSFWTFNLIPNSFLNSIPGIKISYRNSICGHWYILNSTTAMNVFKTRKLLFALIKDNLKYIQHPDTKL